MSTVFEADVQRICLGVPLLRPTEVSRSGVEPRYVKYIIASVLAMFQFAYRSVAGEGGWRAEHLALNQVLGSRA